MVCRKAQHMYDLLESGMCYLRGFSWHRTSGAGRHSEGQCGKSPPYGLAPELHLSVLTPSLL